MRKRQTESWPKGVSREISYRLGKVPMSQYVRAEAKARPKDAMVHYYGRTLSWAEIDDATHLERAQELIYPRISRIDKKSQTI